MLWSGVLAGCGAPTAVDRQDALVVVTLNAPTAYYFDRGRYAGPDFEMATAFARDLGRPVRFEVAGDVTSLFAALADGRAHWAAAGLTLTARRMRQYLPGPVYQQVRQQVVCRRGGRQARGIRDLNDVDFVVAGNSGAADRLAELKKAYPDLRWRTRYDTGAATLLQKVWQRDIDCTLADSPVVAMVRRDHPELVVMFELPGIRHWVWYFSPAARQLRRQALEWFRRFSDQGRMTALLEKYYGFIPRFDYVDTRTFLRRIQERLPLYEAYFRRAGQAHALRWTLLAAQAYQESHWDPFARSPTGVRGMMMLTQQTARELGVHDRLDVWQSIDGGARYLAQLIRRLPPSVREPDRTWFALAAYNVGLGHFYDARRLARRLGRNPDRWSEIKDVLPLLSDADYYRHLRYGYARGQEAVQYVAQVRHYEQLLQRFVYQQARR